MQEETSRKGLQMNEQWEDEERNSTVCGCQNPSGLNYRLLVSLL